MNDFHKLRENFQEFLNEEYSPEQQKAFENFKMYIMKILEARSNLYAAANNMKYEKMSYNDIAKSMTSEFQSMFGIDPQALKYFGKYADDYPLTSEKGKMLVSMFKEGVEKNTIQTMVKWAETYSKKISKQTDDRIGGALEVVKKLLDDGIQAATKFKEVFKLNEGKEKTNEIFGLLGDKAQTRKAAKALDALEKALFELNFLDILGPEDYEGWMLKYEELRGRVMAGLEDEDRKKYDVAYGSSEDDLDENDKALDEIINEAKPNLKKALPTMAARNVERNNLINADIEDMMDMVGGAGKGENSEEAKILFKASNASAELENALTDLQMYFEDDLGEGKKEE